MKKLTLIAMLLSSLLLSACASFDAGLPNGKADKVRYVRTGKFSSTTIEAEKFEKTDQRVTAGRWSVKHSNAWIPNVEITAEGYERVLVPAK